MNSFPLSKIGVFLTLALCLAGCGGTKMLKHPKPVETTRALAVTAGPGVNAALDWVIVRDGPGTWARNADWDEYRLRVSNPSDAPLTINRITVFDSLDTAIASDSDRSRLVKGSKNTARRYKDSGVKVKAGSGVGTMLMAGTAVTAVGVGAATAVAYGSVMGGGAAAAGGTAAAASGLILLGPALVVGGIVRGVRNSSVNNEIGIRQTDLPLTLAARDEQPLVAFFPLAPSPTRIEVSYTDASGDHVLVIDTQGSLGGLHLGSAKGSK